MCSLWRSAAILSLMLTLASCADTENFAPVTDVSAYEAVIRSRAAKTYVAKQPISRRNHVVVKEEHDSRWSWPVKGTLLHSYTRSNKGIDIAGRFGQPVVAASSGRVVYAGGGLRGYGQLVILKHDNQYLSVYAYNSRLFVEEGDWVRRGQKIADMGSNQSGTDMLHFEIRRQGIPINPMNILL